MATITNLTQLVEPLKRALATPGDFDTFFPNSDDDTLFAYITDGFSEVQLDGFLKTNTVDLVTGDVQTALLLGEASLVVIYTSMNILTAQLRNLATSSTYKAGPVEYSTSSSASVIKSALDAMQARKLQLLKTNYSHPAWIGDGYWGRVNQFQGGLRGSNFHIFYPDDINPQSVWDR